MIRQVVAGCSLLALLAIGSLPAQAQTPKPAPATPANTQPAQVSAEELRKFSNAVKQILTIADTAENQMRQAVQTEGLTDRRFQEIHVAARTPNAKLEQPITPQEQQKYNQAVAKLANIQQASQTQMDQAVQKEGLKVERFNEIFAAVQKSPQLRQEVQKMIQN